MKIEEGVYYIKISSMIRVSQEDKNVINYCPAELENILFFENHVYR